MTPRSQISYFSKAILHLKETDSQEVLILAFDFVEYSLVTLLLRAKSDFLEFLSEPNSLSGLVIL